MCEDYLKVKQHLDLVKASALTIALSTTVVQSIMVRPAFAQNGEITDVILNPVENGVEILLEGTGGDASLVSSPRRDGTIYSAEISNVDLNLPSGQDFRADNPAPGVESVLVEAISPNTVQVTVVGETIVPTVQITPTPEGFVVDANTTPIFSQTPITGDSPIRVVVTAEKTEADAQDVPISLTTFTAQELEDADVTSFEDIAGNTPNFSVYSSGGNRNTVSYSLRGLSNADNFASRDTVGFYIDDVPYDFSNFIGVDLSDLERVEVLRGPQNTLYGRSSQGGVVNIITRSPAEEFEFNTNFSYGTYDDTDIGATLSIPIIPDELGIRLSGNYNLRDGYVYNRFLDDDLGDQSGGNGRARVVWTPNDQWEVSFNASYDDYKDGAIPLSILDADPFTTSANFNGSNDLLSNTQALKIAYENDIFRATSITTRRFSRQRAEADADVSALDIFQVSNEFDSNLWSQEIRFQSPSSADRLSWIGGVYFEYRDFSTRDDGLTFGSLASGLLGNPFLLPGTTQFSNGESDQTTYALFGQVTYRPIEPLALTTGLRYETTNSNLDNFQDVLSIPGFPSQVTTTLSGEANSDAILPRFALNYDFNDNVTTYASISRGYKPAGVNFRPEDENTLAFDEELSWNYELGVKTVWLEDRLGANFSVFYNPIRDYQVISVDLLDNVTSISNADAEVIGVEMEVKATPMDGFDLIAGVGYASATIDEFTGEGGQVFQDNRISFSPDLTYNLAAQYRHSRGFFGRLELQGFGSAFFDSENTLKQDPYAIVNARLGYEYNNYGFYVFANNLLNTEYTTNISNLLGNRVGTFGVPATVGFQIRTKL